MTIPSAFVTKGTGDKLTAGDVNTLNADIQMALDRRAGQTDTLASIVSCGGAGRIVDSYVAGADASTTYLLGGANSIINASGITTFRAYTLSNTGAIAGDRVMILNPSAFAVIVNNSGGTLISVLGPDVLGGNDSTWGDFLFNGTAWIVWRSAKPASLASATFTASGTWTCPRGVTLALLIGCGGGGGGGGGTGGSGIHASATMSGGGGGGGALTSSVIATVTPGPYTVTIGAAGVSGTAGNVGGDGGDTIVAGLATFLGAQGGLYGVYLSTITPFGVAYGGSPVRNTFTRIAAQCDAAGNVIQIAIPSAGGYGRGYDAGTGQGAAGSPGMTGPTGGFSGGISAAGGGGTNSSYYSGGGGAGGGAGPFGAGGGGGIGGASSGAGAGTAGANGTTAAANTGAGGGGGGSGGFGSTGQGAGSSGGAGGSGQITIIPLR